MGFRVGFSVFSFIKFLIVFLLGKKCLYSNILLKRRVIT